MYPYKLASHSFNMQYQAPRSTQAPRETPADDPKQTVVPYQQPVARRQTQCHYTGYIRDLTNLKVCRCENPGSHGETYSPNTDAAAWHGVRKFDLQGLELDWRDWVHRSLDVLSKDYAVCNSDIRSVYQQVLHPDCIRALEGQEQTLRRMRSGAGVRMGIPYDTIWYGPVNPRGCMIISAPELCQSVHFTGSEGAWDAVTGRQSKGMLLWETRRLSRRVYRL